MQKQPFLKRQSLHLFVYMTMIVLLSAVWSCRKPIDKPDNPVINAGVSGIYILNEGLFQMNNSTISYYDFASGTFTEDLFLDQNHRGLGDTGNDLQKYGSKLYCVVNGSNRLEIMDLDNATSLKVIDLTGKQPRKITFYQDKAYLSCFDGTVVRVDTASLTIDGTLTVGSNPEGLCVANHKLYVANSGGLNYPNYGKTVSVINLASFSIVKNIEVVENPMILLKDDQENVFIVSRGNYGNIPYTFQKIDSQTDEVVKIYEWPVLNFTIFHNRAYLYAYNFSTHNSWIKVMDIEADTIIRDNFITDGTTIQTPYSITVNPLNSDVYITDADNFTVNGDVYCFDKDGKKKFSCSAGLNPSCIVFKY